MSKTLRLPNCDEQGLLDQVQVRLVERAELERFKQLLDEHHYLGSLKAVGERLHVVPPKKRTRNSRFSLLCYRRIRVTLSPEPPGIFRFGLAPAGTGPGPVGCS